MRQRFDVVVSRAVAPLERLADYVLPFVKVGGIAVAMKGSAFDEEIRAGEKAVSRLGCSIEKVFDVTLPGTEILRHLIVAKRFRRM